MNFIGKDKLTGVSNWCWLVVENVIVIGVYNVFYDNYDITFSFSNYVNRSCRGGPLSGPKDEQVFDSDVIWAWNVHFSWWLLASWRFYSFCSVNHQSQNRCLGSSCNWYQNTIVASTCIQALWCNYRPVPIGNKRLCCSNCGQSRAHN